MRRLMALITVMVVMTAMLGLAGPAIAFPDGFSRTVQSQEPTAVNEEPDPIFFGSATVAGECVSVYGEISAPAQGHDSDTSDDVPGPICLVQ
jgi:hypothetical protein